MLSHAAVGEAVEPARIQAYQRERLRASRATVGGSQDT